MGKCITIHEQVFPELLICCELQHQYRSYRCFYNNEATWTFKLLIHAFREHVKHGNVHCRVIHCIRCFAHLWATISKANNMVLAPPLISSKIGQIPAKVKKEVRFWRMVNSRKLSGYSNHLYRAFTIRKLMFPGLLSEWTRQAMNRLKTCMS